MKIRARLSETDLAYYLMKSSRKKYVKRCHNSTIMAPEEDGGKSTEFSLLLLVSYIGVITKGAFYEKRK